MSPRRTPPGETGREPASPFRRRLAAALESSGTTAEGRRWLFVPYDQLSDAIGPLSREPARDLGVVLVESAEKAGRRPYHRRKLALVLANLRHFAIEQAARGVAVRHVATAGGYADGLREVLAATGPLRVMRPAERELRCELAPLVADGSIAEIPHEGWLTTDEHFAAAGGPPWRMDAFYRVVRRATGILMERGKPVGGRFSFDVENRKPWRGDPPAPTPPTFPVDDVKEEVRDLLDRRFASHPGRLDLERLPATEADARAQWTWAKRACLPHFGPFEDAMARAEPGLFHTGISPLLNLHRLLPSQVVADAAAMDLPIASKEGFVRQVLGWREFVRHVHEATDGFRAVPGLPPSPDGDPRFLDANEPLPRAFWAGAPSGLACLDGVVADVWRDGHSHHITRLMVLSNLATLLGVSARELADWFWVAYDDAFDWVVEPNVVGMGSFAAGDVMTTKPYVSGAAYLHRMSDSCEGCAFDPAHDCPVTPLYWAFLGRNESRLRGNQRLRMPLASLARRDAAARRRDEATRRTVLASLARGATLAPADLAGDEPAGPPTGGRARSKGRRG